MGVVTGTQPRAPTRRNHRYAQVCCASWVRHTFQDMSEVLPGAPGHAKRGLQRWDGGYANLVTRSGVEVLERRTHFDLPRHMSTTS
jgi:hypothetical protein